MKTRCPDTKRWADDIVGCGLEFEAEPDKEGLIDCPGCGLWFKADGSRVEPQGRGFISDEARAAVAALGHGA